MLTALSAIESKQEAPTKSTLKKIKQFLDYAATNPNGNIAYRASNMIFSAHSNASYLSKPQSKSWVGGNSFTSTNAAFLPNNGAVHNMAQISKHVMSLAVEAELNTLFINSKLMIQL